MGLGAMFSKARTGGQVIADTQPAKPDYLELATARFGLTYSRREITGRILNANPYDSRAECYLVIPGNRNMVVESGLAVGEETLPKKAQDALREARESGVFEQEKGFEVFATRRDPWLVGWVKGCRDTNGIVLAMWE